MIRGPNTGKVFFRGSVLNFMLIKSNTAIGTAHSSVIFVIECQVSLILSALGPVIKGLKSGGSGGYVVVKEEAEDQYFADLRMEMKKKVWEKNGGVVRTVLFFLCLHS